MDKVLVFGTSDVGSIPAGGTKQKNSKGFEFFGFVPAETMFHQQMKLWGGVAEIFERRRENYLWPQTWGQMDI